jgi:peptide/nickel transport system substrate-binding protein
LVDLTYGPGDQAATQFLPPNLWGFNPAIPGDIYNPSLAHDLLAQAGYTNGFTTTLAYRDVYRSYMPNPVAEANAIKADLQAVGITVTLQLFDSGPLISYVYSGKADLFLLGWMADYPHPENFLYPNLCGTYLAFGSTADSVLCSLLEDTQAVSDFNTQLANYQAASLRVNDTLPMLPIGHGRSALIVRKFVAGIYPSVGLLESYRFAFYAPWSLYLPMLKR